MTCNDFDMGPSVVYPDPEGDGDALFIRRCPKCGWFVQADETIVFGGKHHQPKEPNATCVKCGRVAMDFQGFY